MSKQFINESASCVRDSVNGLLWQNPNTLTRIPGTDAIVTKNIDTDKIALICGGGSGHEPSHAGFVFNGCLDGAVCGGVFASPSHKAVFETLKYFKGCKKGVLVIIKNYQGDIINFNLAAEMARAQFGLDVRCVVFGEDVTFSDSGDARRGLAGTTLFYKILAQLAVNNKSTSSYNVETLAQKAQQIIDSNNFLTYGVALTGCTLPGKTKPNVDLGATEMELGLGIHGEAGNQRLTSIIKADEVISKMIEKVLPSSSISASSEVVLALNNLGAVTELEIGILVNAIMNQVVKNKKCKLVRLITGRFMTSLDMAGVSLTSLTKTSNVSDAEWKAFLAALDSPVPASIQFSSVNTESISQLEQIVDPESERKKIEESSPEGTVMRKALEIIFTQIDNAADKFDELDAAVGDGDMGRGVSRGVRAAIALLPSLNFSEKSREAFSELGSAIADAHAGSSGPMVGALVAVGGSQLFSECAKDYLSGSSTEKTIDSFLNGLAAGVDAIQKIGGAKEGDRTMVDVLSPIRNAIRSGDISASKFGNDRVKVFEALVKLAKEKAAAVQQLTAKKGRSRYLEEKCVGKPDPGCEFVVFVLEKMAELKF